MRKTIVADSSGLISLASTTDQNHKKAVEISEQLSRDKGSIIVACDVLSETLNIAGKKLGHKVAVRIGETLFKTHSFVIVDTNEKIRDQAFRLFRKQPDSVSFTDCIVMTAADYYKTKDIFGFDEAFRKNGYVRLGLDNQKK